MSHHESAAAASYDRITRARNGDMNSKEVPFRHFNNYVKKTLVQFALDTVRKSGCIGAEGGGVAVVDLASGRGGDLGKWLFMQSPPSTSASSPSLPQRSPVLRWGGRRSLADLSRASDGGLASRMSDASAGTARGETAVKVSRYEGYDISPECIAEAERRFESMAKEASCVAHFEVADCFGSEFLSALQSRSGQFHIVSIQFAFHYACRSEETVMQVVDAVAACLVPGGVVIVTTVDPYELSSRVEEKRFGNAMYSIELLDPNPTWALRAPAGGVAQDHPLLAAGTGYHFRLKGFVDCVEYVVPTELVRTCMAAANMEECSEVSKPFVRFLREYERDWNKNRGNILTSAEEELTTLYTALVFRKRSV